MDSDEFKACTTRAAFLTVGALGLTLAAADAAGSSGEAAPAGRGAIEAILHKAARHKQVIAAPKINSGAALRYAGNTLNAFETGFGEGPGTLHVACVFYGTALFFVADDTLWSKYQLFDALDRSGDALPLIVHSPQNPFYHSHVSRTGEDFTVEALTKRGVTWFVCNNALNGITRSLAQQRGLDPLAVYADFRAHFVPGTIVVPSGTGTIVLAQEAGFTFLPA
jgi:intracellular sulfur oxidation DsrE/DsrF family protein